VETGNEPVGAGNDQWGQKLSGEGQKRAVRARKQVVGPENERWGQRTSGVGYKQAAIMHYRRVSLVGCGCVRNSLRLMRKKPMKKEKKKPPRITASGLHAVVMASKKRDEDCCHRASPSVHCRRHRGTVAMLDTVW
jgi:hypothetical protein